MWGPIPLQNPTWGSPIGKAQIHLIDLVEILSSLWEDMWRRQSAGETTRDQMAERREAILNPGPTGKLEARAQI